MLCNSHTQITSAYLRLLEVSHGMIITSTELSMGIICMRAWNECVFGHRRHHLQRDYSLSFEESTTIRMFYHLET